MENQQPARSFRPCTFEGGVSDRSGLTRPLLSPDQVSAGGVAIAKQFPIAGAPFCRLSFPSVLAPPAGSHRHATVQGSPDNVAPVIANPGKPVLRRAATLSQVPSETGFSKNLAYFPKKPYRSAGSFGSLRARSFRNMQSIDDLRYQAPLSPMVKFSSEPKMSLADTILTKMLSNGVFDSTVVEGVTMDKFYHQYTLSGSVLWFAIERACQDDSRLDDLDRALALVPAQDSQAYLATYEFHHTNEIHIMHLAASLGNTVVMDRICDHCGESVISISSVVRRRKSVAPSTGSIYFEGQAEAFAAHSGNMFSEPSSHNRWSVESRGSVVSGSLSIVTIEHYTPLHCALYMSKVDAAVWLLDHGADANAANMDRMTPVHILAQGGLPHEFDRQLRDEGLEEVTSKLMEASADLTAMAGDFEYVKEEDHRRRKSPLEIAASKKSSYPKHMLHLLAQSYQTPDKSKPLSEVLLIAGTNPAAAEHLMEMVKGSRAARRRLLLEVNAGMSDIRRTMEDFLGVLKMAPGAAADVLDILTFKPMVRELQKNPLPLHAVLENRTMLCTVRPDVAEDQPSVDNVHWARPVWDWPQRNWHAGIRTDLPLDPLAQDKVYSVEVCVVHLPNLLDLRVLHILGRIWMNSKYTQIFSRFPVQAVVECFWSCLGVHNIHLTTIVLELALLMMLIFVGISPPTTETKANYSHILVESFIGAKVLVELLRVPYGAEILKRTRSKHFSQTRFAYMWQYEFTTMLVAFAALPLLVYPDTSDWINVWKVLIATNIFLRCCKLLFILLRSSRGIGVTIIAVVNCFSSGQILHMMVILGVVFGCFWSIFVTLKDDDKGIQYVFLYLYLALFFGEGDGIENISGFDTDGSNYNGHGSEWLKEASIVFMLIGSGFCMVVLLNLIIAMFSNYYEDQQPVARLLFQQVRAQDSFRYLLRPTVPANIVRRFGWLEVRRFLVVLGSLMILAWFASLYMWGFPRQLSVLLALSWCLLEAAMLLTRWSPGARGADRPHFLWISCRSDFDEVYWQKGDQQKIALLQKAVEELSSQVAYLGEAMGVQQVSSPM